MNTDPQKWKTIVRSGLARFNVSVDDRELDLLLFHADEMLKWNRTTNLTSITDPADVAVKHVVDACIPAAYCHGFTSLLDMGTGAGFPGLP